MANSVRLKVPAVGNRGGTYNVEVYVQSSDALDGIQISFDYDTSVWNEPNLNTDVTNKLGSWFYMVPPDIPLGKVRFGLANTGTATVFTNETLVATVSMQVKSDAPLGNSLLTWEPVAGQGTGLQTILTSNGQVDISNYYNTSITISDAPDTEPPSPVSQVGIDSIIVHIAYSGATDNIGIDHYEIFDTLHALTNTTGETPVVTTTGESADVTISSDLDKDHYITVVAVDSAQNKSTLKSATIHLGKGSYTIPKVKASGKRRVESVSIRGTLAQIKLYLYD